MIVFRIWGWCNIEDKCFVLLLRFRNLCVVGLVFLILLLLVMSRMGIGRLDNRVCVVRLFLVWIGVGVGLFLIIVFFGIRLVGLSDVFIVR